MPRTLASIGIAVALVLNFVALQAMTIGYGTRINDLPYIQNYKPGPEVISGSGLNRDQLVEAGKRREESLDVWMSRFKLYSVEADEILGIAALARIKPGQFQFDPGFYQYGGAFLYPLGGYYLALSLAGVVPVASFERLLAAPQTMDRIWIAGRAFVLAAFALSAVVFFMTIRLLVPTAAALLCLAIYLACPASVMFSVVIKPHWYALLWVNIALYLVTQAYVRNTFSLAAEIVLGIALGLAVASAVTFGPFAAGVWVALLMLAIRHTVPWLALARVPAVAGLTFVLFNPYYFLNWRAFRAESAAAEGWFKADLGIRSVLAFIESSLFSGFGIVFVVMMLALTLWLIVAGPTRMRLYGAGIVIVIAGFGALTANLSYWNTSFRYVSYLLPAGLVFLAAMPRRWLTPLIAVCAVATVAQAAPLKLAYFDEDNDAHSTRLNAARWINANVPAGAPLCLFTGTIAPYDAPPVDLPRYKINTPECRIMVRVERQLRGPGVGAEWEIEKRFTPRYSPAVFPLVWEHINPQITVYRKRG